MRRLNGGSEKYGKCEICKKEVCTSYIKRVKNDAIFGHKECIENEARNKAATLP